MSDETRWTPGPWEATTRCDYSHWRSALHGENPPVHENEPQPGRYYMRQRHSDGGVVTEGKRLPVAIWKDDNDEFVALVGFDGASNLRPADGVWTYVCQYPISDETYQAAFTTGQWPDDPAPIDETETDGDDSPFGKAKSTIAKEKEIADLYLSAEIEAKDTADAVSALAKRVGSMAKRADDLRKQEKQPFLDAGREVDDKWRDVIAEAQDITSKLKRHLEPYLLKQREADRERQEAERNRADELRKKAAEANDPDSREELTRQAATADKEAAEPRRPQAGRTGSRVGLRTEKYAVITDYDALLMHLKDNTEIRELVEKIANRAAKSGLTMPGMEIKERDKAV